MRVKELFDMMRFGPTLGSGFANERIGFYLPHFRKQFERFALDRSVFLFTDSVKPLYAHRAGLDPTLDCEVMMLINLSASLVS